MEKIVKRFSEEEIRKRVEALASLIANDFSDEELLFLGILKGAFIFQSDLMRLMEQACRYDFLREQMDKSSIVFTGGESVVDKNVILLKDVVHTGIIENYLINQLKTLKPKSIKLACLIDKPMERKVDISVDYALFSAQEGIFVGYGMEYKDMYGQLPYIGVVER